MKNIRERINFLNNEFLKNYQGSIRLVFRDGEYELNKSDLSYFEAITIIMTICEVAFTNNKLKANDKDMGMLSFEMLSFMMEIQQELERRNN